VAQIGAPHGLRGEVRLRSFTEDPMALTRYGALEAADGSRAFQIEAVRPAKDLLIARFAGVGDRAAAAKLRNLKLYVSRARLPEPEKESYYHGDLIGLAAVDPEGAVLGTVCAVQNFGAGDLIEIAPSAGGSSFLLPFTNAFVPVVDIPGGRVVIQLPTGLLGDTSPLEGEVGSHAERANREGGSRTLSVRDPPPHPSPSRGEGGGCG
jgi:16S rRNA processing protein RimM